MKYNVILTEKFKILEISPENHLRIPYFDDPSGNGINYYNNLYDSKELAMGAIKNFESYNIQIKEYIILPIICKTIEWVSEEDIK